jgi:alpha-glucosidase
MDYHLGGFRAVRRADFRPQNRAPLVLGTRCHQLAMYVCFDNPNPMVADYPAAYRDQPGFEFVRIVPTFWDETRVLAGEIGRLLVTARRKDGVWYLGGLAAGPARALDVPLAFLGEGTFALRLWRDPADDDADPNELETETREVRCTDALRVRVGADGGFVARVGAQSGLK